MLDKKIRELAWIFKNARLWEHLDENYIFAFTLEDGRHAFINLSGGIGKNTTILIYPGEKAFRSFLDVVEKFDPDGDKLKNHEIIAMQDCIQCIIQSDMIFTKREAFAPIFLRLEPQYVPVRRLLDRDKKIVIEVFEFLLKAAEEFNLGEKTYPEDIGFFTFEPSSDEIPIFEKKDSTLPGLAGFDFSAIPVPKEGKPVYPTAAPGCDFDLMRIKKSRRAGTWEARIVMIPDYVREGLNDTPFFPYLLAFVENNINYAMMVYPVRDYKNHADELMSNLRDSLFREKVCPQRILARDDRTYFFFKDFCDALDIPLDYMTNDHSCLEEFLDTVLDKDLKEKMNESFEDMLLIIKQLARMSEEEQAHLPANLRKNIEAILESGRLPADMAEKFEEILELQKKNRHLKIVKKDDTDNLSAAQDEGLASDRRSSLDADRDGSSGSDRGSLYSEGGSGLDAGRDGSSGSDQIGGSDSNQNVTSDSGNEDIDRHGKKSNVIKFSPRD